MKRKPPAPRTGTGALNLQWATLLVEELVRGGVRVCCLASGSRSSPLAVAVARHKRLACVVHVDERGAAFYALGVARASGQPAVWITTSGSAVANGFPAVVEADCARVPLILVTADRPPELRETGANQTINQVNIFGRHVRWQFDLPCPTPEISPAFVLTTVDQALHRARTVPAGPVHLNCMFREPLLPKAGAPPEIPRGLEAWHVSHRSYTTYVSDHPDAYESLVDRGLRTRSDAARRSASTLEVAKALRPARRGVLVAGELRTAAERQAVCALAATMRWPLLPDITSGLRLGACAAPRAAYADQLLLDANLARALRPDAVLHVGARLTSKRMQEFLSESAPGVYAHIRNDPARLDPDHQVSLHVQGDIAACCRALAKQQLRPAPAAWAARWQRASASVERALDAALGATVAVSEPAVARAVSRLIPRGHGLFVASSMPIRDLNMYGAIDGATPHIAANRGASGIDGSVATAAGFSAGLGAPVTALVGDLALLHDLNSLALAARSPTPLTIVVINNDGGGIFSFLPMAQHRDVFEQCFGTPHGLRFEAAAALFRLEYVHAATQSLFESAYRRASRGRRSCIIEVNTDRTENVRLHETLQARIRARLGGGGR